MIIKVKLVYRKTGIPSTVPISKRSIRAIEKPAILPDGVVNAIKKVTGKFISIPIRSRTSNK